MISEKLPINDRKYAIMVDSTKHVGRMLFLCHTAAHDNLNGWWTNTDSDSVWLMSRAKANDIVSRLQYNNPRIVSEDKAKARINKQVAAMQTSSENSAEAGDFIWVTRLGEMIPFERMGERHLINTLKFIRRRLSDLQEQHSHQAASQNIFGDNPEGFTGFEDRIEYMKTAERLASEEIETRGIGFTWNNNASVLSRAKP